MNITEVIARAEIQEVLWRYARGVDRNDYDLIASVYHPEGTDQHSNFSGLGTDFARGLVDRNAGEATVGQHHITNMTIEMDGDNDARVESYFLAYHPHREDEPVKFGIAAGRYLDHFQRRDGEWKILARRVVMDWTRDHVDGAPWPIAEGRPEQGRRKWQNDSSYTFLVPTG